MRGAGPLKVSAQFCGNAASLSSSILQRRRDRHRRQNLQLMATDAEASAAPRLPPMLLPLCIARRRGAVKASAFALAAIIIAGTIAYCDNDNDNKTTLAMEWRGKTEDECAPRHSFTFIFQICRQFWTCRMLRCCKSVRSF